MGCLCRPNLTDADADRALARAQKAWLQVEEKQASRWITAQKFVAASEKAQPGKAIIEYQARSEETAMFASGSIAPALVAAGWRLEQTPRPVPYAHPAGVVAATFEIFLYSKMKINPDDPLSPIAGLKRAFAEYGFPPPILGNNTVPEDSE